MSITVEVTGGGRLGWFNASWPFVRLSVSVSHSTISGWLLGTYKFLPEQISKIEPYGSIPIIGKGIRIIHIVPEYPEKIIFWYFGNPQQLIDRIKGTGFQTTAPLTDIPIRKGIPVKWSAIIISVIIWNILFIIDMNSSQNESSELGIFSLIAIALLFVTISWLKYSHSFQKIVMKPGRSINEIRPILHLLQFISGVGTIAVSMQLFTG